MSYDIWISREDPALEFDEDRERSRISADEWRAIADADSDLQLDGEWAQPGAICYQHRPVGRSDYSDYGWFEWYDGYISSKNATREMRAKMYELASALDAYVYDDDGHLVDENGDISSYPTRAESGEGGFLGRLMARLMGRRTIE